MSFQYTELKITFRRPFLVDCKYNQISIKLSTPRSKPSLRLAYSRTGRGQALLLGVVLGFVLGVGIQSPASGQVTDGFHFLNLSPGGRISGLGGYHSAFLQGGIAEAASNPAYLAFTDSLALHFSVSRHPGGLTATHNSVAGRLPSGRVGYLALRSLGYGELERRDESGVLLGGTRALDAEVVAGTGFRLSDRWSAGVTASLIHANYAGYHSSAIAAHGGLLWRDAPGRTAIGLTVRNLGSALYGFTPESKTEELPFRWAVGITHKPEYVGVRLMLTLEGARPKDGLGDILAGTEFLLSDNARVRIGYHSGIHRTLKLNSRLDFSGVHFGFGLRTGTFRLDLARTSWGQLGGITQLAISLPLRGGVGPF